MCDKRILISYLILVLIALVASGIAPYDRLTWFFEVLPVLLALPVLLSTYRRFPLTALLYTSIFIHALILIYGGAYTYSRVPLGNWVQAAFDMERNRYDMLGHLWQGLVPALVTREILVRRGFMAKGYMLGFMAVCVALAVSAFYEMLEWWAALALAEGAVSFLGTQGDPWDTQSDLFLALIGAIIALVLFSKLQNRQFEAVEHHLKNNQPLRKMS